MNELPTHSPPKRFFELRQYLKFETEESKEAFITLIRESSEVLLGSIMLGLNEKAKVTFPDHSEIPVPLTDLETLDMEDLAKLIGETKVTLSIDASDDLWRMNYETMQPELYVEPSK